MKSETTYNKIVNIADDGEITVLHYVFTHPNFCGAVGGRFYPISKTEYDEAMEDENIIDAYLRTGFEELMRQLSDYEKEAVVWDLSYRELWEQLRIDTGLTEEEAYVFECVGGGRCFDENFQGNVNPELSIIIREFESK